MSSQLSISELLEFVYGDEAADIAARLGRLIATRRDMARHVPTGYFDQTDAVLITYGDMVQCDGEKPLQTLYSFLNEQIGGIVKGVHLLPFYPWSSDDGFSVIDYAAVDPALGNWDDVRAFGDTFRLMFDAVVNHISQESEWFEAFKRGENDYFVTESPETDLSAVFRPRALPLLTPVETANGTQHVWTTFSADQIDLNYESADLLLEIIRILLAYADNGAQMIRLDAIGFMWKEAGTRCLHLPQTHALIQLMRAILNEAAPQVGLVTETNVPHVENISYFGDGRNEAQMVYNFSLPPLTLHAFHTGDATVLSQWAKTLDLPSDQTTFFNFCASHDGIGVTPARGILRDDEIAAMAQRVEALGGRVNYKTNSDGSQSAYELNINYLDALGVPSVDEDEALIGRRFLCSQAIMLALRGVPGIYFHSLFGSRGWQEGVALTGRNRTINRQKLQREQLENELASGLRRQVFDGFCRMLKVRAAEPAFHPNGDQTIVDLHPAVFAVQRGDILCLHNVSADVIELDTLICGHDLLTDVETQNLASLPPYTIKWIRVT